MSSLTGSDPIKRQSETVLQAYLSQVQVNSTTQSLVANLSHHYFNLVPLYEPELKTQCTQILIELGYFSLLKTTRSKQPSWSLEELKVNSLLLFLKFNFSWVDSPKCERCSSETQFERMDKFNFEESEFGDGVVEVYKCIHCKSCTRFARYRDPRKVVLERRGRCGEYTTGMLAFGISLDLEVRKVEDNLDHVWVEVFIAKLCRWVHLDPSEGVYDQPLLYALGWNKPSPLVLAVSLAYGYQDLSLKYNQSWQELASLRKERGIQGCFIYDRLQKLNLELLGSKIVPLYDEGLELYELACEVNRGKEVYQGRTSGSLLWRSQRGEVQSPKLDKVDLQGYQKHLIFDLNHPQFQLNQLQTNGNATIQSNPNQPTLLLTSNQPDQLGSIFLAKSIKLSQFCIQFQIQMDKNGADGMAFVIQTQGANALGSGGAGLGYANIQNGIAIEFDTYMGVDRCEDPDDNHISLLVPSNQRLSSHHHFALATVYKPNLPQLNDGTWIQIQLLYLHQTIYLQVGGIPKFQVPCALDQFLNGTEVFLGFTAATGGIYQSHKVMDWQIYQLESKN